MNLESIAIVLIIVSAVFKMLALYSLSNKKMTFEQRKKKYAQLNIPSYICLVPGFILLIYVYFTR